jgi:hypothetical protein
MIVSGLVQANGDYPHDAPFTVEKNGAGVYDIYFDTRFATDPAVVANVYGQGLNTVDNTIIEAVDRRRARVITGDYYGGYKDRAFTFIATDDGTGGHA